MANHRPGKTWRALLWKLGMLAAMSVGLALLDARATRRARRLGEQLEAVRQTHDYVEGYVDGIERRAPRRRLRAVD